MNKPSLNLQDIFLNQVRKENIGVTIYLVNSVQLRGMVRGFDAFTILLDSVGRPTQLVYKHAVASIVPQRPVSNFYQDGGREGQGQGPGHGPGHDRTTPPAPRPPAEPPAPAPADDEE
jgi:host factor-I protein